MSDDVHSLTGAYVLNALSDNEREAFEEHMRGCRACVEEVVELGQVVLRLADLMACSPPPDLRERVLAGIED